MWICLTQIFFFFYPFVCFPVHANQRAMLERLQSALRTVKESKRNYLLHFFLCVWQKWGWSWFGAVFHIQLCRWGSSVKYCVLFSKVCSARCVDGVKVRTTCSHVRGVRCLIKRMLQEMRCMVDFAVMMMQPLWLKQQLMKGNLVVILSPVRCKTAQDIMSICGKRRLVPALMVVRL